MYSTSSVSPAFLRIYTGPASRAFTSPVLYWAVLFSVIGVDTLKFAPPLITRTTRNGRGILGLSAPGLKVFSATLTLSYRQILSVPFLALMQARFLAQGLQHCRIPTQKLTTIRRQFSLSQLFASPFCLTGSVRQTVSAAPEIHWQGAPRQHSRLRARHENAADAKPQWYRQVFKRRVGRSHRKANEFEPLSLQHA
jgi:hypothetical protein